MLQLLICHWIGRRESRSASSATRLWVRTIFWSIHLFFNILL